MTVPDILLAVIPGNDAAIPFTSWSGMLTWAGLGLLLIVSILRGWLVPIRTHEREIKLLTDRIREVTAEKDEWRAASLAEQAVAQETRAQHRLLLESGTATTHALEGLRMGLEQAARGAKR